MGHDHVKGSPNSARKCYDFGHRNSRGEPCGANVIKGTRGCWRHGGKKVTRLKAEGQVVVELRNWGLGDTTMDPGEVLLRLVTQSAARCQFYAGLLEEAYDAADRLQQAETQPDAGDLADTARLDLERVFNHGGVAALIGHTYAGTQTGGVVATGEKIRGLADLEAQERDRCATFASKAVAAGLAERQVRLAERYGAQVAGMFAEFARALGRDPDDPEVRAMAVAVISRNAGIGPAQIEGVVA